MSTGGAFKFPCPQCGQRLKVEEEAQGLETECPSCGRTLTIPWVDVPIPYDLRPANCDQVFVAKCSDSEWRVLGWVQRALDPQKLDELLDKVYACFEGLEGKAPDAGAKQQAVELCAQKKAERAKLLDEVKAASAGGAKLTFTCPRYYRYGRTLNFEQDFVEVSVPYTEEGFVGHLTGTVADYQKNYFAEISKLPFDASKRWLDAGRRDTLKTLPGPPAAPAA